MIYVELPGVGRWHEDPEIPVKKWSCGKNESDFCWKKIFPRMSGVERVEY